MKYLCYLTEDDPYALMIAAINASNLAPVTVAARNTGSSKLADIPSQQGGPAR